MRVSGAAGGRCAALRAAGLVGAALWSLPCPALELEVTRLDGSTVSGTMVRIAPRITLRSGDEELAFDWSDVLSLRPLATARGAETPPASDGAEGLRRFVLADGSEFAGRIVDGQAESFVVRLRDGQTCRLELGMVESITPVIGDRAGGGSPTGPVPAQPAAGERPPHPAGGSVEDVAIVSRGPESVVLRGRLRQVTPQGAVFEWNGRELELPWKRLAGLHLARPTPRSATCLVRLAGGETLAGRVVAADEHQATLHSSVFDGLSLAWSRIERIDSRSERLVFLSELEPAGWECESLFERRWEPARDRTLLGAPIRLNGRAYARGIVMHSRSRITWRLEGRFRTLAATVGIVDEMRPRGSVAMRVLGDGRVLWSDPAVRGTDEPRDVVVRIENVDELVLEVDFGEDLDLSDHAAWAFARLIR